MQLVSHLLLLCSCLASGTFRQRKLNPQISDNASSLIKESVDDSLYTTKLSLAPDHEARRKRRIMALKRRHSLAKRRVLIYDPVPYKDYKIKLTDHQAEYTGSLQIDGQDLSVIYDSGSSTPWVFSSLCSEDHKGSIFDEKMAVKYGQKTTYVKTPCKQSVHYGTGALEGRLGVADISIGEFVLRGAGFGLIEKTDGDSVFQLAFDGICGIAFPMNYRECKDVNEKAVEPSLLANINHSNLRYKTLTFSFKGEASMSLGMAPIEGAMSFKVDEPYYWQSPLKDIIVAGNSLFYTNKLHKSAFDPFDEFGFNLSAVRAETQKSYAKRVVVFDTGTSILTMPAAVIERLQQIPNLCESGPIKFVMSNGKTIDIEKWYENEGGRCTPWVTDLDVNGQEVFILGQPFFDEYLVQFDSDNMCISAKKN